MIENLSPNSFGLWRFSIALLAALCLSSFVLSAWLLNDFPREQAIVEQITEHLPPGDLPHARELASELRLHSWLLVLLAVNLAGSALALTLLARAYFTSERHLRRVRFQAEDILASLDQGVLTADLDGRVLNVNPKAHVLLGEPELGAQFALTDLDPAHLPLDDMRTSLLRDEPTPERQYSVERDHHIRYLRAGCSVLRDHDQQRAGVVIHLRDVTEKTLMQQRLLRMERYMGLGSLAAGLQHEIKNPLSALALHIQLLREGLADQRQDPAVDESLQVLRTEVGRITRVLEGFRDFASVQQLDVVETDLRQLVDGLLKLIRVEASEKDIKISHHFDADANLRAKIDATKIEQVVLNLILNAFAAMPHGGELVIELAAEDDEVVIEVGDTGCGISEALHDKVFDPYFTTKAMGTGMGLALCDKIVRQHEGTIDFTTSPSGTTFTIRLPANLS